MVFVIGMWQSSSPFLVVIVVPLWFGFDECIVTYICQNVGQVLVSTISTYTKPFNGPCLPAFFKRAALISQWQGILGILVPMTGSGELEWRTFVAMFRRLPLDGTIVRQ